MSRVFAVILLGLSYLTVAACSPAGAVDELKSKEKATGVTANHSFKALLSRTDEVAVCKQQLLERYNDECPDTAVCAVAIAQSYCQCSSEVIRAEFTGLEVSPNLLNALIQVKLNSEVNSKLFNEDGGQLKEEFEAYLIEQAEYDLGFSYSDFHAQIGLVSDNIKPKELDLEHYANVFPSCGTFVNRVLEVEPKWQPSTGLRGYYALRAAKLHNFKAMLSRTDEVEVCTRLFIESPVLTDGRLVKPTEEIQRPICECLSDSARYFIRKTGVSDPKLENALIQTGLNFDNLPIVLNTKDGGLDAFTAYIEQSAEQDFGFASDEFLNALNSLGPVVQKVESQPFTFLDEVPSCRAAFILGQAYYPEEELHPSMLDWKEKYPELYDEVLKARAENGPLRGTIN